MRPIALKGHERAITFLKYNRDGDLLFTSAKDGVVCAWYTHNGERLGTYEGHRGAVWTIDVSSDSQWLLSGAADKYARLWEVETGKQLFAFDSNATVRSVNFTSTNRQFCSVSDAEQKLPPALHIYKLDRDVSQMSPKPLRSIQGISASATQRVYSALWTPDDRHILTCGEDTFINVWDAETGECVHRIEAHTKSVNKLAFSQDGTMFISASSDYTAKLFDTRTYQHLKTYKTEKPLNSAAISPIMEQVIVGGGQEAMGVTTTAAQQGKFETHFFHMVFEEELGLLKGHFGPIHILAFAPDGKGFASGSEDGFVRLHHFDASYLSQKFD